MLGSIVGKMSGLSEASGRPAERPCAPKRPLRFSSKARTISLSSSKQMIYMAKPLSRGRAKCRELRSANMRQTRMDTGRNRVLRAKNAKNKRMFFEERTEEVVENTGNAPKMAENKPKKPAKREFSIACQGATDCRG